LIHQVLNDVWLIDQVLNVNHLNGENEEGRIHASTGVGDDMFD